MKKEQAVKLWGKAQGSTEVGAVIDEHKNKTGWPGARTLERYVQAGNGFEKGLPSLEIARHTGWRLPYVEKIRRWWNEEFGGASGSTKYRATLKIGADVQAVTTPGYYNRMFGEESPAGAKYVKIRVVLAPSRPMRLDMLVLQLWDKRVSGSMQGKEPPFEAVEAAAAIGVLTDTCTCEMTFRVPGDLAISTKDARIYALANGSEWFSEAFCIDFGTA